MVGGRSRVIILAITGVQSERPGTGMGLYA